MKTKFCGWFLVVALCAGVQQAVAQTVKLGILKATNQIVLSWPATVANGVLLTATNLTSPNWVTVSNVVTGTVSNTVTVTNTLLARFFRLYIPAGMALIPAGTFTMGDSLDGESDAPPTNIYVSAFYMDQTDVTEGLWQQVYNWALNHGYSFDDSGSDVDGYSDAKGPNYPVVAVNWYDCVKWCNARSEMAGRTPAYYKTAAQTAVYRTGELDLANGCVNWTGGYRLATEAEWEKAARGGLSGQRFPWGYTISESQANYYSEYEYSYDLSDTGYNPTFATGNLYTSPVGSFAANGYGLYDMAGNVWQWCWDWYGTPYGQPTNTNPTGAGSGSGYRVLRGGYWGFYAYSARCASRGYGDPADAYGAVGFRCVRGL
jgi:formylglycine-generating enzyme required for sulfatase activity